MDKRTSETRSTAFFLKFFFFSCYCLLSIVYSLPSFAAVPVESEAAQKWKSLKAQEEWVARLKKQIQGETNQLSKMRATLAQAFKLDIKKLEAGLYDYDEKSDKFIEKKETQKKTQITQI